MDKIICIGKNYLEHAAELGETQPELPVIFLKPPSVLKQAAHWDSSLKASFPVDNEVVAECELVLEVAADASKVSEHDAAQYIRSVTVGFDMTLRARQRELKQKGQPWTTAKVFADAAIIGPWISVNDIPTWLTLPFGARSGNQCLQTANAGQMLHKPFFLLHYVSQFFPLCAGDIIFTGTPAGCRSMKCGEKVNAFFNDHSFSVEWQ